MDNPKCPRPRVLSWTWRPTPRGISEAQENHYCRPQMGAEGGVSQQRACLDLAELHTATGQVSEDWESAFLVHQHPGRQCHSHTQQCPAVPAPLALGTFGVEAVALPLWFWLSLCTLSEGLQVAQVARWPRSWHGSLGYPSLPSASWSLKHRWTLTPRSRVHCPVGTPCVRSTRWGIQWLSTWGSCVGACSIPL